MGHKPRARTAASGHSPAFSLDQSAGTSLLVGRFRYHRPSKLVMRLPRGAKEGSHSLQAPPDSLRPHPTLAVVIGSPPDFSRPAQTPCPCLGVKGSPAPRGEGDQRTTLLLCEQQPEQQRQRTTLDEPG